METKKLVIILTRGLDDERSSVAWSIANSALASDFKVLMFLTASGVDWVRKGAAEMAHLNPADPSIGQMMNNYLANGGEIMVCPPCAKVRGYTAESMIPQVEIAGAPAMLEYVSAGAQTMTF